MPARLQGRGGSVPLFWLSLAFICGILIGWWSGQPAAVWWELAGVAGLAAAALAALRKLGWLARLGRLAPRLAGWVAGWWPADVETALPGFILPWLPLALLLGAARYQMVLPPAPGPGQLVWYNDRQGRFISEGVITSDPEWRDAYTLFEMRCGAAAPGGRPAVHTGPGQLAGRGCRPAAIGVTATGSAWKVICTPLPKMKTSPTRATWLASKSIPCSAAAACLTCTDRPLETCARLVERDQGSSFMSAHLYPARAAGAGGLPAIPRPGSRAAGGYLVGGRDGHLAAGAGSLPGHRHGAYHRHQRVQFCSRGRAVRAGLWAAAGTLARHAGRLGGHRAVRGAGRGERQCGALGHHGRRLDLCHPAGAQAERSEQPGLRGGGHGALRPADPVGCGFPALFHGYAGVGAVRRAAGGLVYRACQPLAAAGLCPQAGAAGGGIPAVYAGCPADDFAADAGITSSSFRRSRCWQTRWRCRPSRR